MKKCKHNSKKTTETVRESNSDNRRLKTGSAVKSKAQKQISFSPLLRPNIMQLIIYFIAS